MVIKATLKDIDQIMDVINSGKAFLKSQGLDQWQDGHPNLEMVTNDIKLKNFYIIKKENKVVSCAAIIFGDDPNYSKIYKGSWLTNGRYAVIHRFATLQDYNNQGLATEMINYAKDRIKDGESIRIDTHINNIPMQNLLKKNGFILCGMIYLDHIIDSHHLRLAYEYKKDTK